MTDPLVALITFAFVSTASPGGATSLATASGAQFGFVKSVPLICGIAVTLALIVTVSGTGLSAVILAAPALQFGMKAAGTAYLLWLAFSIIRSGAPKETNLEHCKPIGFLGGVMLLVVNPKAWAMAIGVAGSFSEISDNPYILAATFTGVFTMTALLSLSIWTAAGSCIARAIKADWQWHVFNTIMAILLVYSIITFWN